MQEFQFACGESCIDGLVGPADGATLLMLHACGTGAHALSALASKLVDRFHVLIPNLHGYGRTRIAGSQDGLAQHQCVTERVATNWGYQPDVVFGHSMGGLVALKAAAQGILTPKAMVLMEPTAFGVLDPQHPEDAAALTMDRDMIETMQASLAEKDETAALQVFTAIWNDAPFASLPPRAQAHLRRIFPQIVAETPLVSADCTGIDAYKSLTFPILLLQSTQPPAPVRPIMAKLAALLPDARLQFVPAGGHMGPVQQPEPYAAAMRPFLLSHFPKHNTDGGRTT